MKSYALFFKVFLLALVIVTTGVAQSEAVIVAGNNSGKMLSSDMVNNGWFDITGGRANAPVVGSDGTAYVVTYAEVTNAANNASPLNSSTSMSFISFQSTIDAITTSGQMTSLTFNGIASAPVVSGTHLVFLLAPSGTLTTANSGNGQLQLDILSLPFTSSSSPVTVTLAEDFASLPVISGSYIYVVTTEIVARTPVNPVPLPVEPMATAIIAPPVVKKSFLYIFNFNGSLVTKVEFQ